MCFNYSKRVSEHVNVLSCVSQDVSQDAHSKDDDVFSVQSVC